MYKAFSGGLVKASDGSASSLETGRGCKGCGWHHGPIGDIWSQPKGGKQWVGWIYKGGMIGIPVAATRVVEVDVQGITGGMEA